MNATQRAAKQARDAMTRDELADALADADADLARAKTMIDTWHSRYEAQKTAAEYAERGAKAAEQERDTATARVERARALIAENGCDCDCYCDSDGHEPDCAPCFACRIEGALTATGKERT